MTTTNDAPAPANWRMGEPVNPKNLGNMAWVPYEEALRYLNVNTFLGRWREYDEHGQEQQDRDRIAFCCQSDHGDVLALGSDGGELSSPSWRIVDGPDEILVPVPVEAPAPSGSGVRTYDANGIDMAAVEDALAAAKRAGISVSFNDVWAIVKLYRASLASDASPRGEASAIKVERVEMEDWSKGYAEEAEPIWRIALNGYCADFPSEGAARNFAFQIATLYAHPAPAPAPAEVEELVEAVKHLSAVSDGVWVQGVSDSEMALLSTAWKRVDAALAALASPATRSEEG